MGKSDKRAAPTTPPTVARQVSHSILLLRGQRVILDSDLAALYGVPTKALNQAVKRNMSRFPDDFRFTLKATEVRALDRSQIVTGALRHRDPRHAPTAFTEHGAIMAATVLNSPRAVEMSVYVVRAFVQLREALVSDRGLARRLEQLEARLDKRLATQDETIAAIPSAIRGLMRMPTPKRRGIGSTADISGR